MNFQETVKHIDLLGSILVNGLSELKENYDMGLIPRIDYLLMVTTRVNNYNESITNVTKKHNINRDQLIGALKIIDKI